MMFRRNVNIDPVTALSLGIMVGIYNGIKYKHVHAIPLTFITGMMGIYAAFRTNKILNGVALAIGMTLGYAITTYSLKTNLLQKNSFYRPSNIEDFESNENRNGTTLNKLEL